MAGVGLLLAIAGTASPEAVPLENQSSRVFVPLPDWLIIGALAALSTASLIFIAMILPRPRPRRKKGEDDYEMYYEPRKVTPLLGAFLLLLALTPGAILGGAIYWLGRSEVSLVPHSGGMLAGGSHPLAGAPASESRPEVRSQPASPVTTRLIGTLALLFGFGSLGFVLWLRFGDRLPRIPADFAPFHAPLAAAVETSLDDLRCEPDARIAVIRSYQHFEQVLANTALRRRPSETPLEFMRTALGKLPLPAAATRSLTGLFELARFSRHPMGTEERERAWRSLLEIHGALDEERRKSDASPP
ncbi:MAG TPA: DUF4129 domain-containing protein [Stellaceae bacterium]|nr:DUF4129 domain-containing protein [Stellaceae bacterium]